MDSSLITCTACQASLPEELYNLPGMVSCPACGVRLQIGVFPALFRPFPPGVAGELLLEENGSSCFYHPRKKAAIPCDGCGRFLCALCDCELNGQHLCPGCLETGKKKGRLESLENHRICYDGMALGLAVFPLIIFYFTLITAPLALFIAVRHWKTPTSIVRRTKVRFVAAIVIASVQVLGWIVGLSMLATGAFK